MFKREKETYEQEKLWCSEFLLEFQDMHIPKDPIHGHKKYLILMQKIANREIKVIEIHSEDIEEFFDKEEQKRFVYEVFKNTRRYAGLFSEAIDKYLPPRNIPISEEESLSADFILAQHRRANIDTAEMNKESTKPKGELPPEMMRRYELVIVPGPNAKVKPVALRTVGSGSIGSLIIVSGVVTRTSDIKPCIICATYACDVCGYETYHTVPGRYFLPLVECQSETCKANQARGKIGLQVRGSRFTSYQEIKIQESSDQVPMGHVPRMMTVIAKGETTRQCSPGDLITVTGVFMPEGFSGIHRNGQRAGLLQDVYIDAYKITKSKRSFTESYLSEETLAKIEKEKSTDIYTRLAKSIAPEIYGMEDVKKALLLLLVGGVTKEMKDGMKIRGNINILLMGDPGVAKSQLLKYISHIAPRGVYTTGKGSSGVGLTAAVVRDQITGELVLEGGALVLADMGICCIDEFDKMEESDRTNIHEVMEQQTVSIAKAGITTSLNARTSVLAAANPVCGRYTMKKTPHENINLPAALLSRFDLLFLLLDKPDQVADDLLAKHVALVHQTCAHPKAEIEYFDPAFIRAYVSEAKKVNPIIPKSLHAEIVQKYVEKRIADHGQDRSGYMYVTPRTLLGVIRLSQALARLRFSHNVESKDVEESLRLMEVSFGAIVSEHREKNFKKKKGDTTTEIFELIKKEWQRKKDKELPIADFEKKHKKYTPEQIRESINTYVNLQVLMLNAGMTTIAGITEEK